MNRLRLKELVRVARSRPWREAVLSALTWWNRHQVFRIIGAVALVWLLGATALFLAERDVNDDYATWEGSLWGVGLLLFSGVDQPPKTATGPIGTSIRLISGLGIGARSGSARSMRASTHEPSRTSAANIRS